MQTLLIFAHTFWEDSKVNKALLESAKSLNNLTIHNLSTTYKDYKIDVNLKLRFCKRQIESSFNSHFFGLAHLH